jgi:hypothetical protein
MELYLESITGLFYAGRYGEIIARFVDAAQPEKISLDFAPYVVGSLCFVSRSAEAESLLSLHQKKMTARQRIEASYYLATALRRERKRNSSAKARHLIFEMIRTVRLQKQPDDEMLFFVCCGIAFYRYIDGRFPVALAWAQKAYDHAFRANFAFGRLVAYDMIGHSQLIIGQVRAGIKNLNSSGIIAESLGRGAIKQAVEVATRLYRSTYGLASARELLEELSGAIKACSFENSYTLASLYIELSRLQLLSGEGHKAESSLKEASEWVYRLDTPFLDAHLTFRYAYLATLQGDHNKALDLVRSAKGRALEANSASIMVGIIGLEAKILGLLERNDEAALLFAKVRTLSERSGQIVSQRINGRLGLVPAAPQKRGEDLLGDLIDDVHHNVKDVRNRILSSGFLGLIPSMVAVPSFAEAVVFGFEGDSVTIFSKGFIRHDRDGWPELVRKLIFALNDKRKLDKEAIAETVWRQPYSPLRHDPLIYALIARARKTLEPCEEWLTVVDGFYCLRESVIVKDAGSSQPKNESSHSNKPSEMVQTIADITYRQAKILDLCSSKGAVTNKDICEAFQISEVTAGRDLSDLADKGHLKRIGKGRATTYTKP